MVFSSLIFIYAFLPINFILYFLVKNQTYRNSVLIVLSLAFYAWGEPVWISIMLFSVIVDYANALIAEKYRGQWQSKAALAASVIVNLSMLGFFKYVGFLVENLNFALGTNIPYHGFELPIGISFYTFQTLSYVIDVYRGEVDAQKSPFKLLLFVSLFHQLVAGPIVRYKDIAYEIDHRVITPALFSEGINRFVVGLGKKVILANTAGELSELFLKANTTELSVAGAWFGIILFALQIYFDFSGYSDMAIGLGKMFGFNYKENFNYPYISKSATEFWRRWHMSLGSFFRDYLYIPLGGNQKYPIRNLFIVWFLTGLWHGASWNFVVWGLYYGALIVFEKLYLLKLQQQLPQWISHCYLVIVVLIGWVFFYFTSLGQGLNYIGIMLGIGTNPLINADFSIYLSNNILFVIIAIIGCTPVVPKIKVMVRALIDRKGIQVGGYSDAISPLINFALFTASTILLVGKTYNPFLYFRF